MERATGFLIAALGLALCGASLLLLMLGPSVMADARSPNLAGPGVALWVVDRWPAPGGSARIEVEGHGGSHAGVERAEVRSDAGDVVVDADGKGATWGTVITEGHERGSDTVPLNVPIPAGAVPGRPLRFTVDVDYVAAMSSGSSFTDDSFHDQLGFEIVPRSPGSVPWLRLARIVRGLAAWAGWFFLLLGGLRVGARLDGAHGESLGVVVIGLIVLGALAGYWTMGRVIATAVGDPPWLAEGLTAVWLLLTPYAAFRAHRRLKG